MNEINGYWLKIPIEIIWNMRQKNERNIDLIYSSRTQDRILDHGILRSEVLTLSCRFLVNEPWHTVDTDHQCRKFHVLNYMIWHSRPSNLVWHCHNLTLSTMKSCLPNWSTMASVTWLCSGLKATFLAASNLSNSIKLARQCKPSSVVTLKVRF